MYVSQYTQSLTLGRCYPYVLGQSAKRICMAVTMFGRPGLSVVYVSPVYIASIAPYPCVSLTLRNS